MGIGGPLTKKERIDGGVAPVSGGSSEGEVARSGP
jgi:hypothetical protein